MNFEEAMEKRDREERENPTLHSNEITYPIQVDTITNHAATPLEIGQSYRKPGSFVKIRPCTDNPDKKTYLGLHVGELSSGSSYSYKPKEKRLLIQHYMTNPAIFVFDLNKIVYGCQSWWGEIKSEEDLTGITDLDINSQWYVKALEALSNSETRDVV